ncbi:hypothetical protein ACIBF1_30130 [Spirillospora sp. NPDC050679]
MAKDEFNDNIGTVHRGKGDINQNGVTVVTGTTKGGISGYFSKKK